MEVMRRIVVSKFYAVSISRNWKWMKETKRETPAMPPAPVDLADPPTAVNFNCKLEASLDGLADNLVSTPAVIGFALLTITSGRD